MIAAVITIASKRRRNVANRLGKMNRLSGRDGSDDTSQLVLAPAASATGVREALALTENPLEEAGGDVGRAERDQLLVGSPGSLRGSRESATDAGVGGARPGRSRWRRPGGPEVVGLTLGSSKGGSPAGSPLQVVPLGQVERADRHRRPDHRHQHPRDLRPPPLAPQDHDQACDPMSRDRRRKLAVGDPRAKAGVSWDRAFGVDGEAEQLRRLAQRNGESDPVRAAVADGSDSRSVMNPKRANAGERTAGPRGSPACRPGRRPDGPCRQQPGAGSRPRSAERGKSRGRGQGSCSGRRGRRPPGG